ncbi:N-acetylmuramoyl-L-alanine amidase [Bacillus pseudomycoides]|uniref:N-acetylmuramoyl-L-alanine amidase n=1 Tax=Bacillus pseudomycoides TaxID=64104 RepID=A0AA91VBQ1_9BACI|nr:MULTISPECIES: glucosaminidase domain-containing protein [Bacillus]PED82321.1 N-acetylmuramoyl-L-alanine amidase [Bacillus pseudomycoides]PFW63031.1 N-acetylmuramoyl-L-alanine amidase [Bacillus sp. AFS075034]
MAADIRPFIADAQRIQSQTGIPASIILGQIIFESSGKYPGGLSGLAYQNKNLFGIKGKGTAGTANMYSKEYDAGGDRVSGFRSYNSYTESLNDHAKLLQNERYAKYLRNAKSVEDFAKGIKAGGYATDPDYAGQLVRIIKQNNLTQFDDGKYTFTGGDVSGGSAGGGGGAGGFLAPLFTGGIRALLIVICIVVLVILFGKAFPDVEQTIAKKVSA